MAAEEEHADGVEVVKWYTRARHFPQLIGRTPDGATIWGGPYTYTQVAVGVGVLVLGSQTIGWWGQFELIGNAIILLGITYGTVLLVGRLPLGSRNPLALLVGTLQAFTAPRLGKLAGSPFRLRPPHVARSTLVVAHHAPTLQQVIVERPPELVGPSRVEDHEEAGHRHPRRPRLRPTPATLSAQRTPALSGVQRLLASAGTPDTKD